MSPTHGWKPAEHGGREPTEPDWSAIDAEPASRDTEIERIAAAMGADLEAAMLGGYVAEMPTDVLARRLIERGWTRHEDIIRAAGDLVRDDAGLRSVGHADAGNPDANHYDWFMPDDAIADADARLADFEAKMREALTDPFVHDMAHSVLPLIAAYRQLRSQPASEPSLDVETDAVLASYFEARRGAMVNVCAHKASPPEYPGLALVPVSDIERLERFIDLPRERAEYQRLSQPADNEAAE